MSCFSLHQLPLLSQNCPWCGAPSSCQSSCTKTAPSCGFPCKRSVSWNLGWSIIDKSTWEGWGVRSQNFMMKKMPEENCAFNNWEGWVGHEVSLACRTSILVLDGRVCPGQFPPESTAGSCRTFLEGEKLFLWSLFRISAGCSLVLLGTGKMFCPVCGTTGIVQESGISLGEQQSVFRSSQGCPQLLCLSSLLFFSQVRFLH